MLKTLKNYFFLFGFAAKHTHFIWWCIVDGIIWALYRSFTTVVFIKYLFDWIERETVRADHGYRGGDGDLHDAYLCVPRKILLFCTSADTAAAS